jgi:DNA-binding GntR family transcriptional regulator
MALKRTSLPRTAEAVALAELRDAIVRGDLAPGAQIRQGAAAEELGLSVIPVREALKTLAGEGIVTYVPQRGYTVTELTPHSVDGIFRIREILEGEAEANAAALMRPEDIAVMRAALDGQRTAAAAVDVQGVIASNRRFHFALLDRCDNEWMLRFIKQLWEALEPHRALSYRRAAAAGVFARAEAILAEHDGIVPALENGETPLALQLLAKHRTGGRSDFHRLLSPPSRAGSTVAALLPR